MSETHVPSRINNHSIPVLQARLLGLGHACGHAGLTRALPAAHRPLPRHLMGIGLVNERAHAFLWWGGQRAGDTKHKI